MAAPRRPGRGTATCEAPGCERKDHVGGVCEMHYQRRQRGTDDAIADGIKLARTLARLVPCVAHGCDQPISNVRKGVCAVHYQRIRAGSYAVKGRTHLRRPRITPTEKRCNQCDEVRPASEFRKYTKNVDGLFGHCNRCHAAKNGERNYRLRGKYGISNADYLAMVEAQGGLCAICEMPGIENGHHQKLYIDHCHETGKVRGLLCHPCNVALGFMQDQPERLTAAADYLRRA